MSKSKKKLFKWQKWVIVNIPLFWIFMAISHHYLLGLDLKTVILWTVRDIIWSVLILFFIFKIFNRIYFKRKAKKGNENSE